MVAIKNPFCSGKTTENSALLAPYALKLLNIQVLGKYIVLKSPYFLTRLVLASK
tara:strand:+ start:317 stop:478 length:162 start_codon:yes stop_codon:yes gene_type:complete